jgi:hypothetical protein
MIFCKVHDFDKAEFKPASRPIYMSNFLVQFDLDTSSRSVMYSNLEFL